MGELFVVAILVLSAGEQWNPGQVAINRCRQELQYKLSREVGGRQPDVWVDEQTMQTRQASNSETRVNGNGRYLRDRNDRGRDFTFDCVYNSRSGSVTRADYRWTSSGGGDSGGRVWYNGGIFAVSSGKGLDVRDQSFRDGANVQQWTFAGAPNQLWNVVDLGRGEYLIVNQGSDKALDVGRGGDGANVFQNRRNNDASQRWRLQRTGRGAYQIINVRSGRCLDIQGNSQEEGANVQVWSCSGAENQSWRFGR